MDYIQAKRLKTRFKAGLVFRECNDYFNLHNSNFNLRRKMKTII